MRSILILHILLIALPAWCQPDIEEPWTMEFGMSKHSLFKNFKGINLRFISPKFQITTGDEYWTEEQEKYPGKLKKIRFLVELLYAPPFYVCDTCMSFARVKLPGDMLPVYVPHTARLSEYSVAVNCQYRVWEYKRLSVQVTGGLKFFILTSPDYGVLNYRKIYLWNYGLLSQLDLGMISPFIDIGRDGIYTVGAEIKFKQLYKHPKRRYKLHLRNANGG